MIIIHHRAQDLAPSAIPHRFGVEIDVREIAGELIISHDPANHIIARRRDLLENWLRKDREFLDKKKAERPVYAINIKCDGIEKEIEQMLWLFNIRDRSFVFDMSFPTLMNFKKLDIPYAIRISDLETAPHFDFFSGISAVWVDRWDWSEYVYPHVFGPTENNNRAIPHYYVSPELHGHQDLCEKAWLHAKETNMAGVCTDFTNDAEKYFAD